MDSQPKTIFLVERDCVLAGLLAELILLLKPNAAVEIVSCASRLTSAVDVHGSAIFYSVPRNGIAEVLESARAVRLRLGTKCPMLILLSGDPYPDVLRTNNPFDATLIKPVEASTLQVLLEAATV